MRLAVCALSAVLLSGCSWLGTSGHQNYASGACAPSASGYGYGYQTGYTGANACGVNGGYNVAGAGYGQPGQVGFGQAGYGSGQAGYGQAGYGVAQSGFGANGFGTGVAGYGSNAGGYGYASNGLTAGNGGFGVGNAGFAGAGTGFGTSSFGGGATTLGAGAPFGAAYGQNAGFGTGTSFGTSYASGNFNGGTGFVQNVQGQPIYVPQPYPAYYGVGVPQLRGVSAALPFGLELDAGADFDIGGNVFTEKPPGLALGSTTVNTGGTNGIRYKDAFDTAETIGGTFAFDKSRNTTLLGSVGYSSADGQVASEYQTVDARGSFEGLDAEFSDLELWTIEGGVRQYIGYNPTLRPYVGATAGITHNNSVTMNRTYSSDGAAYDSAPFEYIESGWQPTASAVVGAEMAVGNRAAIGVESGLRWRDNMNTVFTSEDRWSVPVKLRGRVSF